MTAARQEEVALIGQWIKEAELSRKMAPGRQTTNDGRFNVINKENDLVITRL